MKNKLLVVISIVICILHSVNGYASHVAGGEIVYKWVSDSTYHITFKLYRDCSGIPEPNSVPLCITNSCNPNSYSVNLTKAALINGNQPNGSPVSIGCPGFPTTCQGGSLLGYREWWYEGNFTIPSRCAKWIFGVFIDARNANTNLNPNASASGNEFYIQATLNNLVAQGNNSAQFTVKPVPSVCINQPYVYNNGAVDIDNDSLGYKMVQPKSSLNDCFGPINDIPFFTTGGVSYNLNNNPLATSNSFVLDTITGQLTFTPTQIGVYTIALLVTEYRNHVAIASTIRDIQIHVINCNIAAPDIEIDTTTVTLLNNKIQDCAGSPLHFCFTAKSTLPTAVLVPTDNHVLAAPGSTVTYTGLYTSNIYGCFTWNPSPTDTGIKVFSITVIDSSCVSPGVPIANTYTIPLYILPTTYTNHDTSVCSGTSVNLFAHGGSNFNWTVLPGGSPITSLSCTNCGNPVATPLVSTSYVVTSNLTTGCKSVDTVNVADVQPPALPVPTANSPLCLHDTLRLFPGTIGTSYVWTGPNGFSSAAQNPVIGNISAAYIGTFYVHALNGGCSSPIGSVAVSIIPATHKASNDTTICKGYSVQLNAVGNSFVWSVLPGGSPLTSLSCTNCSSPLAIPAVSTVYTVTGMPSCNAPDTIRIAVVNYPATPVPSSNDPICVHDTLKLHAGTVATTYSWSGPNGFLSSVPNPVIPNTVLPYAGTYYYTVANGSCALPPDSIVIHITDTPSRPVVTGNSPVCAGSLLSLLAQSNQNVFYHWTGPNGFVSNAQNLVIPGVATQNAGTYSVTATYLANGTCLSAPGSYNAVVLPGVNASFHFVKDTICQNDVATIIYAAPGATTTNWNLGTGLAQGGLSANPLQVLFPSAGLQPVTFVASNAACADTIIHSIHVLAPPPSDFFAPKAVCFGQPVTVNSNHEYAPDVTLTWNFGQATVVSGYGAGPYTLQYSQPGSYTVSLTTQGKLCTSLPTYDTIMMDGIPDASITTSSIDNICSGDSVHFEGVNNFGYHYLWKQAIYFHNDTLQSTFASVENVGYLFLYVTDQYGCKASDSVYVDPHPCCNVYFPNAFTPNKDGKNDTFKPITIGHHEIAYFRIYNRWGQVVFTTRDEQIGWDGRYEGRDAELGVYFYVIEYKCVTGQYFKHQGEITLIR